MVLAAGCSLVVVLLLAGCYPIHQTLALRGLAEVEMLIVQIPMHLRVELEKNSPMRLKPAPGMSPMRLKPALGMSPMRLMLVLMVNPMHLMPGPKMNPMGWTKVVLSPN